MAVLVDTGELQSLNSTVSNLETQSVNINNVNISINEFKTGSNGILAGEPWQKSGAKLSLFLDAMNKCQQAADALSSAISNAISSLMALWDPRFGSSVDDQYRAETQQELNMAKTELENLIAAAGNTEMSEEDAANLANAIESLNAEIADLEDLLRAIDAFLEEYHRQEDILKELASKLDSLNAAIGGIAASDGLNYDKSLLSNIDFGSFIGLENTPVLPSAGIDQLSVYQGRYNGLENSGTTVNYAIVPKTQVPKYTLGLRADGKIGTEDPESMVKRLQPQLFINCGLNKGVFISDGQLVKAINSERIGNETMYVDNNGMLGTFPNSDITTRGKNGGSYDSEKVASKIDELNINWGTSVFGAIYQVDENGNEIVQTTGLGAEHDITHEPRSVMGQFEDGDYFFMEADGRKSGENGMTFEEIYDYCINTVEKETGKKFRIIVNMDGGGSSFFYANGEVLDNVADSKDPDGRRDRFDGIYVPYPEA